MPYHSAAPYGTYTCNKSIIYVTALYSTSYIANGPFSLPSTRLARPVHFWQGRYTFRNQNCTGRYNFGCENCTAQYNFRPVQSLRDTSPPPQCMYMLRPDLKLLTCLKAGRPNLKPVDPLPSRSTGFKTGQLILSHTWLFRNSACERFVG